jgi:hypothetical protein
MFSDLEMVNATKSFLVQRFGNRRVLFDIGQIRRDPNMFLKVEFLKACLIHLVQSGFLKEHVMGWSMIGKERVPRYRQFEIVAEMEPCGRVPMFGEIDMIERLNAGGKCCLRKHIRFILFHRCERIGLPRQFISNYAP